jgi:inner membrane transporter RhtA
MKSTGRLALPPVVSILLAVFSVQFGATIAKGLFPVIGAAASVAVRNGLSAIVLLAVFRPPLLRLTAPQWRAVVPYGVTIGVMNLLFYQAIARIPLGLGVTLEFIGPLGVAIVGSRRALDVVWVVLAVAGVALITPWQTGSAIDPVGVLLALMTGGCWAAYILLGGRVSQLLTGGTAVAIGMSVATLTVLPFALASGGLAHFTPSLFIPGAALALLSSAIPFTLEMNALRALPGRTFSILMSLEPAVAAMCGLVFLNERLTAAQSLAVGLVMAASVGATVTARKVPVHIEV